MNNTAIKLTKRFCAHSSSLQSSLPQDAARYNTLHLDALKARTADWEPSMSLADLKTQNKDPDHSDDNSDDNDHPTLMITYSAFNPGATRLLLPSSVPLISTTSTSDTRTISSAGEDPYPGPNFDNARARPWPYSLPASLRPKPGTTYDLLHGEGEGVGAVGTVKVGLLQKVLYGEPYPRPYSDGAGKGVGGTPR